MLKSKRFNTAATIILTVLVIITLLPLALIVISSFTKESALIRNGYSFWPQEWSLDAYYYMIKQGAVILRSYGRICFCNCGRHCSKCYPYHDACISNVS